MQKLNDKIKGFNNVNQIPRKYVMAEVINDTPGFPWVMVQFLLAGGSTMRSPVHRDIVDNLEKVAVDDM